MNDNDKPYVIRNEDEIIAVDTTAVYTPLDWNYKDETVKNQSARPKHLM